MKSGFYYTNPERKNPINNLKILFKPKITIKLPKNAIIIITRIFGFFRVFFGFLGPIGPVFGPYRPAFKLHFNNLGLLCRATEYRRGSRRFHAGSMLARCWQYSLVWSIAAGARKKPLSSRK